MLASRRPELPLHRPANRYVNDELDLPGGALADGAGVWRQDPASISHASFLVSDSQTFQRRRESSFYMLGWARPRMTRFTQLQALAPHIALKGPTGNLQLRPAVGCARLDELIQKNQSSPMAGAATVLIGECPGCALRDEGLLHPAAPQFHRFAPLGDEARRRDPATARTTTSRGTPATRPEVTTPELCRATCWPARCWPGMCRTRTGFACASVLPGWLACSTCQHRHADACGHAC